MLRYLIPRSLDGIAQDRGLGQGRGSAELAEACLYGHDDSGVAVLPPRSFWYVFEYRSMT